MATTVLNMVDCSGRKLFISFDYRTVLTSV